MKIKGIFRVAWLVCWLTLPGMAAGAVSVRQERAQRVLDEVWSQLAAQNFEPDFNEKFRKPVYEKFQPEVLSAVDDAELAGVLDRMVHQLGVSHLKVLPPLGIQAFSALEAARRPPRNDGTENWDLSVPGDPGLKLIEAENAVAVWRVWPESAAAEAKIETGELVLAIDGIPLLADKDTPLGWAMIGQALLTGPPGSSVAVRLRNAAGAEREVTLTRQRMGTKFLEFGIMPRAFLDYWSEWLPGDILYIHFSAFYPEAVKRLRYDVSKRYPGAKGLIVDVRNNAGGILTMGQWVVSWCVPKVLPLGEITIAQTSLKLESWPQQQTFRGPVAVLLNRDSYSTAEIFAGCLQDAAGAVLFGETSAGMCLPSNFVLLESGFRLQTVVGSYVRPAGGEIEGLGVEPDRVVPVRLDSLRSGKDDVVDAAAEYLRSELGTQP